MSDGFIVELSGKLFSVSLRKETLVRLALFESISAIENSYLSLCLTHTHTHTQWPKFPHTQASIHHPRSHSWDVSLLKPRH